MPVSRSLCPLVPGRVILMAIVGLYVAAMLPPRQIPGLIRAYTIHMGATRPPGWRSWCLQSCGIWVGLVASLSLCFSIHEMGMNLNPISWDFCGSHDMPSTSSLHYKMLSKLGLLTLIEVDKRDPTLSKCIWLEVNLYKDCSMFILL